MSLLLWFVCVIVDNFKAYTKADCYDKLNPEALLLKRQIQGALITIKEINTESRHDVHYVLVHQGKEINKKVTRM